LVDMMKMENDITYIMGFVLAVLGGSCVVKAILKRYMMEKKTGFKGAGNTIGMIERAIIYIFACLGEFNAISFILAAKSIARFNDLKDRKFAEYYLIGTLMSILFAIVVALIVKWTISG